VTHLIQFPGEILRLRYFVGANGGSSVNDDDGISFLSLGVAVSDRNGLLPLSDVYKPKQYDSEKKYIVVEFRSGNDLCDLITELERTGLLQCSKDVELNEDNKKEYCRSLEKDNKKAGKRRKKWASFLEGKVDEDKLVVFPFAGDAGAIDNAAEGLQELSLGSNTAASHDSETPWSASSKPVTLTVRDFMTIDAPEHWNHALIDFLMEW